MISFLSEEWLTEFAKSGSALPKQKGINGSFRFVFTATPHGKVQFHFLIKDGQIKELIQGPGDDVDAVVTWRYPNAVSYFFGHVKWDVSYMSGQSKAEGNYVRYIYDMQPVFGSGSWDVLLAEIAEKSFS